MHDLIAAVRPEATQRIFKKRSILLYQGEVPRGAFVLTDGIIKVYSLNAAGEEQVATFHVAGECFPTSWIFNKSSSTQYYYEALTDCTVLNTSKDAIRAAIFGNPAIMEAVSDYFVTNYIGLMMRITALEQARAGEKIMFTLYYLLFRYGREVRPNVYKVALSLTHTTIASLVGLTRETTSTELNKLKRQKIVTYTAKEYFINKQALERALGEDSFKDVLVR
jgi:CRP/FNR family transcriptional regulator, anaerobic regulatory protein